MHPDHPVPEKTIGQDNRRIIGNVVYRLCPALSQGEL